MELDSMVPVNIAATGFPPVAIDSHMDDIGDGVAEVEVRGCQNEVVRPLPLLPSVASVNGNVPAARKSSSHGGLPVDVVASIMALGAALEGLLDPDGSRHLSDAVMEDPVTVDADDDVEHMPNSDIYINYDVKKISIISKEIAKLRSRGMLHVLCRSDLETDDVMARQVKVIVADLVRFLTVVVEKQLLKSIRLNVFTSRFEAEGIKVVEDGDAFEQSVVTLQEADVVRHNCEDLILVCDLSLIALNIMTAPGMTKRVFLEDTIQSIVSATKFHLRSSIYPSYDPLMRGCLPTTGSSVVETPTMTKKKSKMDIDENIDVYSIPKCMRLLEKYCEVLSRLALMIELPSVLQDSMIIEITTTCTDVFQVQGVGTLQLKAIDILCALFAKYPRHRESILDDLLVSVGKMPASKRQLRSYRLVEEDKNIQIITALVLKLIQTTTKLPEDPTRPNQSTSTPLVSTTSMASQSKKSKQLRASRRASQSNEDEETLATPTSFVEHPPSLSTDLSFFEDCITLSQSFLTSFLRRCCKGNSGSEVENGDFRSMLVYFVEDILTVLHRPLWPGAELFLSQIIAALESFLRDKQAQTPIRRLAMENNCDNETRKIAIDILGIVAKAKRLEVLTLEDVNSSLFLNEATQAIIKKQLFVSNYCALRRMDACSTITEKKNRSSTKSVNEIDNDYNDITAIDFSMEIIMKHLLLHRLAARPSSLLHSGMGDGAGAPPSDDECDYARHFHLAWWMYQEKKARLAEQQNDSEDVKGVTPSSLQKRILEDDNARWSYYRQVWGICDNKNVFGVSGLSSSEIVLLPHDTYVLCLRLAEKRGSVGDSVFRYIMDSLILSLRDDPQSKTRTRVLKAFASIAEIDHRVLGLSSVQSMVHDAVVDKSILVREASLDLIGRFINNVGEYTSQYIAIIGDRIRDVGVSVRKRVISVLKDIVVRLNNHKGALQSEDFISPESTRKMTIDICRRLSTCVDDSETSVKDRVMAAFEEMWFTTSCDDLDEISRRILLDDTVHQIANVVASSANSSCQWFNQLLKNLLTRETEKYKVNNNCNNNNSNEDINVTSGVGALQQTDAAKYPILARCELLVAHMFRVILDAHKQLTSIKKTISKELIDSNTCIIELSSLSLRCFQTLDVFCKARPLLLSPHLQTLRFKLADQNITHKPIEQSIVACVASIYNTAIPAISFAEPMLLGEVERFMGVLLVTTATSKHLLTQCVRCLCTIVSTSSFNFSLLQELLKSIYMFLASEKSSYPEHASNVQRYLFILGLLCRYFDFDAQSIGRDRDGKEITVNVSIFGEGTVIGNNNPANNLRCGNVNVSVYAILRHFFSKPKFTATALDAMGALFCRRPRLMLEGIESTAATMATEGTQAVLSFCLLNKEVKTFSWELNMKYEILAIKALTNLGMFLTAEEEHVNQLNEDYSDPSSSMITITKREEDSSVAANIIQRYLSDILAMTVQSSETLRRAAVNVIRLVIRQGLVAPFQCIPHLIALTGDAHLNDMAHSILSQVIEKYSDFVGNHALDGILLSYVFQKRLQISEDRDALPIACDVFLATDPVGDHDRSESHLSRLFGLVKTYKKNSIKFSLLRGIIDIISDVSRHVTSRGHTVALNSSLSKRGLSCFLAELLVNIPFTVTEEPLFIIHHISRVLSLRVGCVLTAVNEFCDGHWNGEDRMAAVEGDEHSDDISVMNIRNVSMITISLTLLLLMKQFLKQRYYLSDSKCSAFVPNECARGVERGFGYTPDWKLSFREFLSRIVSVTTFVHTDGSLTVDNIQPLRQLYHQLASEDAADLVVSHNDGRVSTIPVTVATEDGAGAGVDHPIDITPRVTVSKSRKRGAPIAASACSRRSSGRKRSLTEKAVKNPVWSDDDNNDEDDEDDDEWK